MKSLHQLRKEQLAKGGPGSGIYDRGPKKDDKEMPQSELDRAEEQSKEKKADGKLSEGEARMAALREKWTPEDRARYVAAYGDETKGQESPSEEKTPISNEAEYKAEMAQVQRQIGGTDYSKYERGEEPVLRTEKFKSDYGPDEADVVGEHSYKGREFVVYRAESERSPSGYIYGGKLAGADSAFGFNRFDPKDAIDEAKELLD